MLDLHNQHDRDAESATSDDDAVATGTKLCKWKAQRLHQVSLKLSLTGSNRGSCKLKSIQSHAPLSCYIFPYQESPGAEIYTSICYFKLGSFRIFFDNLLSIPPTPTVYPTHPRHMEALQRHLLEN